MAKRISLREFQSQLTARLGSAQRGETTRALLGIESGRGSDAFWLLDLSDSGEIVPLPAAGGLLPVALTKPWFTGVVNIRGMLYSVIDFSAFRGGEPTPRNADTRKLLVGARHGINSALLSTAPRPASARKPDSGPSELDGPPWQGDFIPMAKAANGADCMSSAAGRPELSRHRGMTFLSPHSFIARS
jgi:twitching motility protein PilI